MQKHALRLVATETEHVGEWKWFCGHCAAPSPGGVPPAPNARVCGHCGLGLLLEARDTAVPDSSDAFLVVDSALCVQAMSRQAQTLLGLSEEQAVDRPVAELLVPADAEAQGPAGFAAAIAIAATGEEPEANRAVVRPWNTFGVRLRARVSTCGPPRAALVVLGTGEPPALRAISGQGGDTRTGGSALAELAASRSPRALGGSGLRGRRRRR